MVRETGVQSQVESKIVLDATLLNTKVRIKWSNPGNGVAPPQHISVVAIEKGACGSSSTKIVNFTSYSKQKCLK